MSEPLWPQPPPPTVWTLVFTNVDGRSPWAHWFLSWFRPGFRHVFAMRETAGGILLVQPSTSRLQVEFFPGETLASRLDYTRRIECLDPITTVDVVWDGDETAWVPRGLTCVGTVRALAGLPGKVQTPRGLHRELQRRHDGRR